MATISAVTGVRPSVNNMRFCNFAYGTGLYQQFNKTSAISRNYLLNNQPAISLPDADRFSINPAADTFLISSPNYYTESGNGIAAENPHHHIFTRSFLINKAIKNGTFIPYAPHNIDINFPIPESIDFFYN